MQLGLLALVSTIFAIPTTQNPYESTKLGPNKYFLKWAKNPIFEENLNVWVPSSAVEKLPIVFFFGGFGSNMPSAGYGTLLNQVASKLGGAVVVAWDGIGVSNPLDLPSTVNRVTNMIDVLLREGDDSLQKAIGQWKEGSHAIIDTSNVFVGGHSSGAQIAVRLAQSIPVDGLLLVDPVDSDPMNMTKPVLVEKTLLNVPTMVLSSGLGTVPGWNLGNRFPACCPPLYSSRHFYTMLDTPFKVELKALNYGHADLLSPDPVAWAAHKSRFCASTKDSRATPFDAYRNWNSGAISAFIQMVVGKQKDCKSYKEWLTGGWNVDTELVAIDGKYC